MKNLHVYCEEGNVNESSKGFERLWNLTPEIRPPLMRLHLWSMSVVLCCLHRGPLSMEKKPIYNWKAAGDSWPRWEISGAR